MRRVREGAMVMDGVGLTVLETSGWYAVTAGMVLVGSGEIVPLGLIGGHDDFRVTARETSLIVVASENGDAGFGTSSMTGDFSRSGRDSGDTSKSRFISCSPPRLNLREC